MFRSLPDLLLKSAELYPEKPALRYQNFGMSYRELDLLSERLSSYLGHSGVAAGDRIGIYMDKSIDAVVAIFSILKTGACYVPLETTGPLERQVSIINDCTIKVLITSAKKNVQIHHILQYQTSLRLVIFVDMTKEEFKQWHAEVEPDRAKTRGSFGPRSVNIHGVIIAFKDDICGASPLKSQLNINKNRLAYILYTSGSTGSPKGVMITHEASLAFVNWAYKYFNISPDEKISAVAPFYFDLSIFDIFVTIKAGAALCIVPSGMCGFPQSLAEFIDREKITTWYSVPSILIQLVLYGSLKKRDLSALRQILFAGETFPVKYLRALMQSIPHVRYYNLYGPTETNVCACYQVKGMPDPESILPIGKPCEGTEVFVIDKAGNPAKNGDIGELYVSGPTLMEGYWNDAKKSEEVLLNDFLPSHINQNVYRTGDLAKVKKDGNLEFHGRMDHMIKSRGYRIELGEIESVLYSHAAVKEVIAAAIPDEDIGNKIKVVIILKEDFSITEEEIKSFCSNRLPAYMVPEIITFNNFIPKTPAGKAEREKFCNAPLSKDHSCIARKVY